jgi:ATP-dependent metalloprotease FtsH
MSTNERISAEFSRILRQSIVFKDSLNTIIKNEAYFHILYGAPNKAPLELAKIYKEMTKMPIDLGIINALKYQDKVLYIRGITKYFFVYHFEEVFMLFVILFIFYRIMNSSNSSEDKKMFAFQKNLAKVTFNDLVGIDEFKEELMQIVDFLRNREKYLKVGATVPKGVLLCGPPGCGKTQLARAVANEANLPFISLNASELLNPIMGESQVRIKKLFNNARSQKKGAIIFIDEIDTLQSRSDTMGTINSIQNELLTQLDGFYPTDNIIVIAATNREKVLDNALTRSGRFDFKVNISLPFYNNRIKLFEYYLNKVRAAPEIDAPAMARLTVNFSPADIKNLVNKAAYHAINEKKKIIDQSDLQFAYERVKLGIKSKQNNNKDFLENAAFKEAAKAVFCIHNKLLPEIKKVSINSYSAEMIGKNIRVEKIDSLGLTKQELLARIDYFLVAKAAEEAFIPSEKQSSLPGEDLTQAGNIARSFVGKLGMLEEATLSTIDRKYLSDAGKEFIDNTASNVLNERYKIVKSRVSELSAEIKKVKEILLEKEEITMQELLDAINQTN